MDIVVNARFLSQPITGTQRFAIEISRELKKLVPTLRFVTLNKIIHSEIAIELEAIIIGKSTHSYYWEQFELPQYLAKNKNPILLNLCNIAPAFYKRNIIVVHDISFYLHPEWFSKIFTLFYNTIIPYCLKRSLKTITVSENSRNDLIQHLKIKPSDIEIVNPGIAAVFRDNYRRRTEESLLGNYILSVSSLDVRKNFKSLIQAFKKADLAAIKLVIVGQQNKVFTDNALKELIEDDARIIFTGYVNDDELATLYRQATLFAYPSYFEGFGIPPLEAMACGCPTLVSNTTSLPEICGDASIYIDPYDIDSIKDGIIKVINDELLQDDLRKKGFQQVTKYDWSRSALKMVDIIARVMV